MMAVDVRDHARCRFCEAALRHPFVDLGMSPLCQKHVTPEQLNRMEPFYPLHTWVCERCLLVQLEEYVAPKDIFEEYAYFSSFSESWVEHARQYCDSAVRRFGIDSDSMVMEVASNDGYLLQHFAKLGIPCLGIEPAANVAQAAITKGIPTAIEFLGEATAKTIAGRHGQADLIVGNNVLAHVPDLNDFVKGLRGLLKQEGTMTMEFPHLHRLVKDNQFDTIYHEHFSYFSFITVDKIFRSHGLILFDVEELSTHGGSLRIFAKHADNSAREVAPTVKQLLDREVELGYTDLRTYSAFADKVRETKRKLLEFLIKAKRDGKSVVGYGAPGKGNTLLNYCGIRTDFIDYTVDRNPYKQGNFTPGTHIPIHAPEMIEQSRPDYLLILPWNLKDEIMRQMAFIREWGGRFVVPIPEVCVY
jgi:2-polyprenyl-3-methyl-5-hydroxy-6-metoxy-1,4-benzoquinol methylase